MPAEPSLRAPLAKFTEPPLFQMPTTPPRVRSPRRPRQPQLELVASAPIELRPADEWVQRVCAAILEVLHHKRSPIQLRGAISAPVMQHLLLRRNLTKSASRVQVSTVKVRQQSAQVLEVSASFWAGERLYPMALRIERIEPGWQVTALEIGPH